MSHISSIKLSLVAYPNQEQLLSLQAKCPTIVEYLYLVNAPISKEELSENQGILTRNKYTIQEEDNSVLISSNCRMVFSYICAFLNANRIDFNLTQLHEEHHFQHNNNDVKSETKYLLEFEESHLSQPITKETLAKVAKSPIQEDLIESIVRTTNLSINSLKELDYWTLSEEESTEFIPY